MDSHEAGQHRQLASLGACGLVRVMKVQQLRLHGYEAMTSSARQLGISPMTAQRVQKKALATLREQVSA